MKTKKHPDAVMREMVDALFAHVHARDIRLNLTIRWPDGLKFSQRSLNDREKRRAALEPKP